MYVPKMDPANITTTRLYRLIAALVLPLKTHRNIWTLGTIIGVVIASVMSAVQNKNSYSKWE